MERIDLGGSHQISHTISVSSVAFSLVSSASTMLFMVQVVQVTSMVFMVFEGYGFVLGCRHIVVINSTRIWLLICVYRTSHRIWLLTCGCRPFCRIWSSTGLSSCDVCC